MAYTNVTAQTVSLRAARKRIAELESEAYLQQELRKLHEIIEQALKGE